jgi:hypothetical protein
MMATADVTNIVASAAALIGLDVDSFFVVRPAGVVP